MKAFTQGAAMKCPLHAQCQVMCGEVGTLRTKTIVLPFLAFCPIPLYPCTSLDAQRLDLISLRHPWDFMLVVAIENVRLDFGSESGNKVENWE